MRRSIGSCSRSAVAAAYRCAARDGFAADARCNATHSESHPRPRPPRAQSKYSDRSDVQLATSSKAELVSTLSRDGSDLGALWRKALQRGFTPLQVLGAGGGGSEGDASHGR